MGSIDEPALEASLLEAKLLRPTVAKLEPLSRRVASPLLRAVETMRVCCVEPFTTDQRLRERNLGELEGRRTSEIEVAYPEAFLRPGVMDPEFCAAGGETLDDFCDRISDFLDESLAPAEGTTFLVGHNGWIRTARYVLGMIRKDEIFAVAEAHLTLLSLSGRSK
jgi:broad specificity phosphatase PhoE